MSKSKEALTVFSANWEKLQKARPAESDFSSFGYPGVSFQSVDEIAHKWALVIDGLESKGAWSSPELALADTPLSASLIDLSNMAAQAETNGVSSLGPAGFINKAADVQNTITSLSARRISITRDIARDLTTRGHLELERVIGAAKASQAVLVASGAAAEAAAGADNAHKAASEANDRIQETRAEIAKIGAEATAAAEGIEENRARIEATIKSTEDARKTAEYRITDLEGRAKDLEDQIKKTQNEAEVALRSVQEALRGARDQGLAESFQSRSYILRHERRLWTLVFLGAVAILATVSVTLAIELDSLTYERLVVLLLRKIVVAAPLIWIGWYSAKQVGRVARVQEDYEYKAASALAFQSYKEEAVLGGDPELIKKLLGNAIGTFGDNPVRLYENAHSEAVTPLESALQKLPPDTIAAILALTKLQLRPG